MHTVGKKNMKYLKHLLQSGEGGQDIRITESIPNPSVSGRSACTAAHSPILTNSAFPEPDHWAAVIRDVSLLNYVAADRNKDLSMSQSDY